MTIGTETLLNLDSKTAIVTGASGGIGGAIARRLAEAGAQVAVAYRSNQAGADAVVGTIEAEGRRAIALQADLTDEAAVARLLDVTTSKLGAPAILVNNAGAYPLHDLLEMAADDWDAMMAANLRSTFLCTQAAARAMKDIGGGAIVNIASIASSASFDGHSHYAAAKAGVVAFTRSAASELGRHGIRVNAVSPGLVDRDGLEEDWPTGVQRWQERAALGRIGQPADIANACLFLVAPASGWITGINLVVDGGMMASPVV